MKKDKKYRIEKMMLQPEELAHLPRGFADDTWCLVRVHDGELMCTYDSQAEAKRAADEANK